MKILGAINESLITMASASTMAIGAAAANIINVTGTTTITAFDTVPVGTRRKLRFTNSLTVTYNVATMLLPGSANIAVVAGDVMEFISAGGGAWWCTEYQPYAGYALASNVYTKTAGDAKYAPLASPIFSGVITQSSMGIATQLGTSANNSGAGILFAGSSGYKNWMIANCYSVGDGLEFTPTTGIGNLIPSSTPVLVLKANGNVGIGPGMTNPQATLHGTGTTILGGMDGFLYSTIGNKQFAPYIDENLGALCFASRTSTGLLKVIKINYTTGAITLATS